MDSSAFNKVIIMLLVMICSIFISFDIFASGRNALGQLYFYLMLGNGILGLLAPKMAVPLVIFQSAYLDLLKRMLIFDSGVSQMDLAYVLGMAPALMVGATVGTLYGIFTGRIHLRKGLAGVVYGVVVAAGVMGAFSFATTGKDIKSLAQVLNLVGYLGLLYMIPLYYGSPSAVRGLIRWVMIVYTPAAFYLIYQGVFGIFKWEHQYLLTGLSNEIRQLGDVKMRVFGTLSSASTASSLFSIFAIVGLSGAWSNRPPSLPRFLGQFFLFALFTTAAYYTFSRNGWVLGAFCLIGWGFYRTRVSTFAFYGVLVVAFITLILAAPYLLRTRVLNEFTDEVWRTGSDVEKMTLRISTFSDRLVGFRELQTNYKCWTPFGAGLAGFKGSDVTYHDFLTHILVTFGFIPVAFLGVIVVIALRKLHGFVYEAPGTIRNVVLICLSASMAFMMGTTTNPAQLATYPINIFIVLFFAFCVGLRVHYKFDLPAQEEKEGRLDPAPGRSAYPGRPYRPSVA